MTPTVATDTATKYSQETWGRVKELYQEIQQQSRNARPGPEVDEAREVGAAATAPREPLLVPEVSSALSGSEASFLKVCCLLAVGTGSSQGQLGYVRAVG